jgi:hypothetical protein
MYIAQLMKKKVLTADKNFKNSINLPHVCVADPQYVNILFV